MEEPGGRNHQSGLYSRMENASDCPETSIVSLWRPKHGRYMLMECVRIYQEEWDKLNPSVRSELWVAKPLDFDF